GTAVLQHQGRGDALSPLWIGHADNRTFDYGGMLTQHFFDFQRRYFVPARLEDVDVRAPQNAIDTVLDDRSVAGAKPAFAEGIARGVRLAPVFREDGGTTDFDLARCSRRNRPAVLADKLHLDARQRRPNASRHALAAQWVR